MGPLFWRIFLGLWLGSTTLMVGSALMLAYTAEKTLPAGIADRIEQLVRANVQAVLALQGHVPQAEIAAAVEQLSQRNGLDFYLVDSEGRELFGRPLPPEIAELGTALEAPRYEPRIMRGDLSGYLRFADTLRPPDGRPVRMLVRFAGPEKPPFGFLLSRMALPLLTSVLLAGVISAAVARHLVEPITRLRAATRRIAHGDLDARVGDSLEQRRDEFSALGRDFDGMADRISGLLNAQRRLMLDLSHELRSPLARLRLAVELARRPNPRADLFERMERDTDRMDILIGELLLLARLSSPELKPPLARFDFAELVREIVDDVRVEVDGSRHQLQCRGIDGGLEVLGNRELLRRAVENVLRNALQHTPAGTVIEVALQGDEAGVQLSVADRGPGVPAARIESLFRPFARGEGAGHGGSGLGLAIARGAAQRHGGTLQAANREDGTGLVVTLSIPADLAA